MFYWWGSADFIVLNHSAAGPMVLKAPLVTCGCAAISALWLCRWEVELSNSVIGYERRGMCKLVRFMAGNALLHSSRMHLHAIVAQIQPPPATVSVVLSYTFSIQYPWWESPVTTTPAQHI